MNGEVLKRSEAVALQIAVANGHSTPAALLQQFAHGALQTKQRETLLMVLKVRATYTDVHKNTWDRLRGMRSG